MLKLSQVNNNKLFNIRNIRKRLCSKSQKHKNIKNKHKKFTLLNRFLLYSSQDENKVLNCNFVILFTL